MIYRPTWASVKQHPAPDWFHNDKLGILVVWGLFSVPGWAPLTGDFNRVVAEEGWETFFTRNPYAEWYYNSIRIDGSPSQRYHQQTYGPNFTYDDFGPLFQAGVEKWDPEAWADLFRQAGARYVVFLTKHHDGFLLWPSRHPNPYKKDYQVRRDVPAELGAAVRRRGLRLGLYYSGGLDWSFKYEVIRDSVAVHRSTPQHPAYVAYCDNHWRELIDRYEPSVLWSDIGHPAGSNLPELFAYYYNRIPDGVINDRFSQVTPTENPVGMEVMGPPPSEHFDFRTPEYSVYNRIMDEKWESNRGLAHSYSYNRNEQPQNYLSPEALIHMLVDVVSKNGNLLLSFGPMANGAAPELQRQRLQALGHWLAVNGEAIFGTRPWLVAGGSAAGELPVRFTAKAGSLYAILLGQPPAGEVSLPGLQAGQDTTLQLLGRDGSLAWRQEGRRLVFTLPDPLPAAPAHAFKLTPAPAWLG